MSLNILRLCVGCESIEDLRDWQETHSEAPDHPGCVFTMTTMYPRRAEEIIGKGSLYWVIKGRIAVRQGIVAINRTLGPEGEQRTRLVLKAEWVQTVPTPTRPFQGWRYVDADKAPPDLGAETDGAMPPDMAAELKTLGLL
jgi:hypothetical protein